MSWWWWSSCFLFFFFVFIFLSSLLSVITVNTWFEVCAPLVVAYSFSTFSLYRRRVIVHLLLFLRHNCDSSRVTAALSLFSLHLCQFSFLLLLVNDSSTVATAQATTSPSPSPLPLPSLSDSSIIESQLKSIEQAQNLLSTVVQLGNRHDIEQLTSQIKVTACPIPLPLCYFRLSSVAAWFSNIIESEIVSSRSR